MRSKDLLNFCRQSDKFCRVCAKSSTVRFFPKCRNYGKIVSSFCNDEYLKDCFENFAPFRYELC